KNIDSKWIGHIDAMDQLRKGISLRGYGNVDPVLEYKKEGFEMFEDLTMSIQDDTCVLLLTAELQRVPQMQTEEKRDLRTNGDGSNVQRPTVVKKKIGRNDPCPCGSGKKYKDCCGK
ncbi:MAG: SEC-C domain-containing protein, partial [Clostridia bacterium]|nr:SEC-C domain-containing protein [Clostridia bacterium]